MNKNELIWENLDLQNKQLFYLFHGKTINDKHNILAQLN